MSGPGLYTPGMPRCSSERDTGLGLGWSPPTPVEVRLETARLLIRNWELSDAEALFETVSASRTHLTPWMAWAREGYTESAHAAHYITTQMMAARDAKGFSGIGVGIFERESGRIVGGTGVHGVFRDTATAETGYWVRADAAGRGYATETTARVLSWALDTQARGGLGLRRVVVYCSSANVASSRVPEKLGLTPEVRQREDYFVPGIGCTDRLGWGVLASEWDCRRHAIRKAKEVSG